MFKDVKSKILNYFWPESKVIIAKPLGTGISASNVSSFSDYGSGSKYAGGFSRDVSIDIHDHFSIRQKVRNQMYDSVEGRALVNSIVDTTVETGLRLKPVPISEVIGIAPELLEKWAENVALRFHLWASSKKSHRSEVSNFYQNQHFYMFQQQRDNDVFTRLFYNREKDLINPLQIEFEDSNKINGYGYTSTYMQLGNDDGIIRDSAGRELAYKLWKLENNGKQTEVTVPATGEKSGRIFMLHGFRQEYAGQGRGYSRMAHLIQELSDLTDFKVSTIQKAINQASFIAAVENDSQDASQPLSSFPAGPAREYGTGTTATTESSDVTTEPNINWEVRPEATIRQPGAMMIGNLKRGDHLKYLQDTSPSAQYNTFVDSFFSIMAASTSWSIELVLKRFNANYSASRATLLLCWRTAQIERNEMIADFCDPIYYMWLSEEIAAGRIQCPGWSDPLIRAGWLNCEWSGASIPDIDPLKSLQAGEKAVELSAKTLDDVARDYNGSSGKANRMKNARQFEELPNPPWPRAPKQQQSDEEVVKDNE